MTCNKTLSSKNTQIIFRSCAYRLIWRFDLRNGLHYRKLYININTKLNREWFRWAKFRSWNSMVAYLPFVAKYKWFRQNVISSSAYECSNLDKVLGNFGNNIPHYFISRRCETLTWNSARLDGAFLSVAVMLIFPLSNFLSLR